MSCSATLDSNVRGHTGGTQHVGLTMAMAILAIGEPARNVLTIVTGKQSRGTQRMDITSCLVSTQIIQKDRWLLKLVATVVVASLPDSKDIASLLKTEKLFLHVVLKNDVIGRETTFRSSANTVLEIHIVIYPDPNTPKYMIYNLRSPT